MFPVIGFLIGLGAALLLGGLLLVKAPLLVACLLSLAAMTLLTAGLHEDGLADTVDGIFGAQTPATRLALMRKGNIGAYGTLALMFSLALRVTSLASLDMIGMILALIVAATASRAAMVALAYHLKPARREGLAVCLGKPSRQAYFIALMIAVMISLLFLGPVAGIAVLCVVAAAIYGLGRLAVTRIGGITGDILGAGQQISETLIFLTASLIL